MMKIWKELKKIDQEVSKKIKSEFVGNDYVYNKWLFRGLVFVFILLAVYVGLSDGFTGEYIFCQSAGYSFEHGVLCEYAGQRIGDNRSWLNLNFGWLFFMSVMLTLVVNHLLYNRRKKR